jgi:hypothetical protein
MSIFVYSRPLDEITAFSMGHSQAATELTRRNFAIEIVSNQQPMWLYCRHKQTESETGTQRNAAITEIKKPLANLAHEFGLNETGIAKYLADASQYGYCVMKGNMHHRLMLVKAMREVQMRISDPEADDGQITRLHQEESKLAESMAHISENMINKLGDNL